MVGFIFQPRITLTLRHTGPDNGRPKTQQVADGIAQDR